MAVHSADARRRECGTVGLMERKMSTNMTEAVTTARRIVAAHENVGPDQPINIVPYDAVDVACAFLALTDAKDDLSELWWVAEKAKGNHLRSEDVHGFMDVRLTFQNTFTHTVAQRLIARVRAAEGKDDSRSAGKAT